MRTQNCELFHLHRLGREWLPEGPFSLQWKGRQAVGWVTIQHGIHSKQGALHLAHLDGEGPAEFPLPQRPGFVIPTDVEGKLFLGMEKSLGYVDLSTSTFTPVAFVELSPRPGFKESPQTIINDGKLAPGGRHVVFGTKHLGFSEAIAGLYLFDVTSNRVTCLRRKQICSNGKCFIIRDDGQLRLLDIDSPTKKVISCNIDLKRAKLWGDSEVEIDLRDQDGFPDGMVAVDDNQIVVAIFNPNGSNYGEARLYRLQHGRSAKHVHTWTTPLSPQVTCPHLFEHKGQVRILITTAAEGMDREQFQKSENAGGVFIGQTDLKIKKQEVLRLANV